MVTTGYKSMVINVLVPARRSGANRAYQALHEDSAAAQTTNGSDKLSNLSLKINTRRQSCPAINLVTVKELCGGAP